MAAMGGPASNGVVHPFTSQGQHEDVPSPQEQHGEGEQRVRVGALKAQRRQVWRRPELAMLISALIPCTHAMLSWPAHAMCEPTVQVLAG